jgi:hypothetical protein
MNGWASWLAEMLEARNQARIVAMEATAIPLRTLQ